MSIHNDICGSTTLYGEGTSMVLTTIYDQSIYWHLLHFFSCCYGNDRSRYSLVIGQLSKRRLTWGVFFQKSSTFFQLEKTLRAAEKDAGGGILKSAQDFFENCLLHRIIM